MKTSSTLLKATFPGHTHKIALAFSAFLLFTICLTANSSAQFTEVFAGSLTGVYLGSAAWGDYDNDGDLDILLTGMLNSGGVKVSKIYQNSGTGFAEVFAGSLKGVFCSSTGWGDYDNDGDLDIILTGSGDSGVVSKIYENTGTGFTELFPGSLTGVYRGSVAWGDYDNDGDLDILLTGWTGVVPVSKIYRNTGTGFTEVFEGSLTKVIMSSVAWGDYDNDGDLDILLTGRINTSPYNAVSKIYQNTGNGFTEVHNGSLIGIWGGSVAWGDYDNDSDLDILLSGWTGSVPVSRIYQNTDSSFVEVFAGTLIGFGDGGFYGWNSTAWGDYDNDGNLDILLTGFSTSTSAKLYRNTGTGFVEVFPGSLSSAVSGSVEWGDYDNDGDLDILMPGARSVTSKIYQNTGTVFNHVPDAPTGLNASISNNDVSLNWNQATDSETPQDGLTYNLRISTSPDGINTLSPMADVNTGYRHVVRMGNTNHVTTWTIKDLPDGTYYWSVQAVDNAFAGSPFTTEGTFSIGLGNISGTITSSGSGIAGVTVKLLDGNGFPASDIDPTTTDAQGQYSFTNIPAGNYGVMIVEPLGYSADQNPKSISLASGNTNTVDFILSATVVSNAARAMGYWKHQFDVYVTGRGNAQESESQLIEYITRVHSHYTPHFAVFAGKTSFEDWQEVLTVTGRNAPMLDRAEQQLAALVLNFTSLKIVQYTVATEDNRTAGDVLTYASTLVADADDSNDGLAKDLVEQVNNQQLIGPGIIPSSSVLYKGGMQYIMWDFDEPKNFILCTNYPNPFNPATTIQLDIPKASFVTLKVYNVLGQEVTTLVNEKREAGGYEIEFNASSLSSGVYFYRLVAGDCIATKKLLLVR
jgi:predicted nucleotidyltransferase